MAAFHSSGGMLLIVQGFTRSAVSSVATVSLIRSYSDPVTVRPDTHLSQTFFSSRPTFAAKSQTERREGMKPQCPFTGLAYHRAHSGKKVGTRNAQMLRIFRVAPFLRLRRTFCLHSARW